MADETEYLSFPTNPEEFESDDRISCSLVDKKYIAVQEDGDEFEFDHNMKRWVPAVDTMPSPEDDILDNGYDQFAQGQKRKNGPHDREDNQTDGRASKPKKKKTFQPKQNTAIYVTGIPLDATVENVKEVFDRFGIIMEEIDSKRPRIKMYTDAEGNFKGDALIVYFKPESVDLAIDIMDETDFRISKSGLGSGKMRVQAADSSYKKTKYDTDKDLKGSTDGNIIGGNGHHTAQARSRAQDKAKIIKKTQKLEAKLADWGDDEPAAIHSALIPPPLKKSRYVILEHMFTLEELEEDPAVLLDIKEDIRDECAKLGDVTNVVLYDKEVNGIVRVKFKDLDAAEKCIHAMHGRHFGGRTVEAYYATGKEKFSKSKQEGDDDAENDSD